MSSKRNKQRIGTAPQNAEASRAAIKARVKQEAKRMLALIPKGTFARAGGAVGGLYGQPALGGALGQMVANYTGYGDYTANSLVKGVGAGSSIPKFSRHGRGTTVVHTEFLGDINGSSAFTNRIYKVNPGDATTFPWLSQIADSFDKYKFRRLMFSYRTSSTDYSTTSTLGMVVMAAQYNVLDPQFNNKLVMENYDTAISTKISQSCIYGVECKNNTQAAGQLYVRATPNPTASDQRLYDLCNFNLATIANPSTAIIGELWVSYEVELYNPNITYSQYGTSSVVYHGVSVSGSATAPFTGMTERYNNLDAPLTFPSGSTFKLPEITSGGTIEITLYTHCSGTSTADGLTSPTVTADFGTAVNVYRNGQVSTTYAGLPVSSNPSSRIFNAAFRLTRSGCLFSVVNPALPSGAQYFATELIVRQLPYDYA